MGGSSSKMKRKQMRKMKTSSRGKIRGCNRKDEDFLVMSDEKKK